MAYKWYPMAQRSQSSPFTPFGPPTTCSRYGGSVVGGRYTRPMVRTVFRDPKVRQAYVFTKIAVFAAAALATWPLSKIVGPQAWWGLGIFGVVLIALSVAVLGLGGGDEGSDKTEDAEEGEACDPTEPVALPIEDSIDLHPFPPREVPDIVTEYLAAAQAEGFREVRLIHGRGIGVQRERVRSLLERHPLVREFRDAPPERGGWGATVAFLKDET